MKITYNSIVYSMFLLFFCGCGSDVRNNTEITGLEKMGKINVLYVGVAETMDLSSKSGQTWQKWLVRGGAFYQIDLEKIEIEKHNKGEHNKSDRIRIILDKPSVYPVANMEKTKTYDSGTAYGITDKAYNEMMRRVSTEANKVVAKAAHREEYMNMAKDQAQKVMKQMLGKDVELTWRKEP